MAKGQRRSNREAKKPKHRLRALLGGAVDRPVDSGHHVSRQRAGFGSGDAFGELGCGF